MNKYEKKYNECYEQFEPLLSKNMYFDNTLYKIKKYSTIYIYCYQYELGDQLNLNNDVLFLFASTKSTVYNHFRTTLINNKIVKIKISELYNYVILDDTDNISNIYFIGEKLYYHYIDSEFYKNKGIIETRNNIFKFIYSMLYGPCVNKDNEYYNKYRIQYILDFFNRYKYIVSLPLEGQLVYFNELQVKYPKFEISFYNEFLLLYDEYKELNYKFDKELIEKHKDILNIIT